MINVALEYKQMRHILEAYTFAEFQEQHNKWLVSGRQLWYVTGNYEKEAAVELVEKTRSQFKLNETKMEDLVDVRAIALEDGHSFLIEQPLEDEKNENSCIVCYYEIGVHGNELR